MRKKALLIGINYRGQQSELRGSINDVNNVKTFLVQRCNYSEAPQDMVILTEDQQNPVFHYSSHGSQVKDPDGYRVSGYDDTIVPLDYQQAGQLDSDFLHRAVITPLLVGVKLTAIGGISTVNYVQQAKTLITVSKTYGYAGAEPKSDKSRPSEPARYYYSKGNKKQFLTGAMSFVNGLQHRGDPSPSPSNKIRTDTPKKTTKKDGLRANTYLFSGCMDSQTSADVQISGGATDRNAPVMLGKHQQIPQLSTGERLDLNLPVEF
ncbi:peptidase C14, caspase domain-containing protein [Geranomyces variabilis]|nr:peptidase C14, caspase domain-containing protein [Geranomyces variabilis]KAJ3134261.1 Ca(2+)-dependent cysteine protease [Geranomyces variabilis]